MAARKPIAPGDHVSFMIDEDVVVMYGIVENILEPKGKFKGGVHVACYFVVDEKDLTREKTPKSKKN
jgi:hypothetical protein